MLRFHDKYIYWISRSLSLTALTIVAASCLTAVLSASAKVTTLSPDVIVGPTPSDKPLFSSYKGVTLGVTADAARKLLGNAKDKADDQDLYLVSDKETAEIFYDPGHLVMAISVTYSGDLKSAPTAKEILGEDVPPKPDGGIFKLVRYPKAGCYVSYSKTGGDNPTVSITIQKV